MYGAGGTGQVAAELEAGREEEAGRPVCGADLDASVTTDKQRYCLDEAIKVSWQLAPHVTDPAAKLAVLSILEYDMYGRDGSAEGQAVTQAVQGPPVQRQLACMLGCSGNGGSAVGGGVGGSDVRDGDRCSACYLNVCTPSPTPCARGGSMRVVGERTRKGVGARNREDGVRARNGEYGVRALSLPHPSTAAPTYEAASDGDRGLSVPDSPGTYRVCYFRTLEAYAARLPMVCSDALEVVRGAVDTCGICRGNNATCAGNTLMPHTLVGVCRQQLKASYTSRRMPKQECPMCR